MAAYLPPSTNVVLVKHDLSVSQQSLALKKSIVLQIFSWQSFSLNVFGLWSHSTDIPKGRCATS